MLREPEASLVRHWITSGGVITVVPFGVSGKIWTFANTARQSGMWGAMKRYGGRFIDSEAFPFIALGQINATQARVGVVWEIMRVHGPMSACALGEALTLSDKTARKILVELQSIGAAERIPNSKPEVVRAIGACAPHWRNYLPIERRAA